MKTAIYKYFSRCCSEVFVIHDGVLRYVIRALDSPVNVTYGGLNTLFTTKEKTPAEPGFLLIFARRAEG